MTWRTQLDVAGVTVAVAAPQEYANCILGRLGEVPGDGVIDIRVTVGDHPSSSPDRPPDQEMEGFAAWEEDGSLWIGRDQAIVRIENDAVLLGGPLDDEFDEDVLDDLLQFGVAHALATPDRLLIHGAVVASGDDALVVVGRSGRGKSTLAASALIAGWQLLGDDLALVHPRDSSVRAVQRPPMVPADVAEAHDLSGKREAAPRGRIQLPIGVLQPESRRLVGVVSVAHGIDGGVQIRDGADVHTLDDAMAVPPFRSVIRRHLAAGAALVAKPTVVLEHAQDPLRRVDRAIESLAEAMELCRSNAAQ
jgi:hypothetical protein